MIRSHVEAAADHGSKGGGGEAVWSESRTAEEHMKERLSDGKIGSQFRPEHVGVHAAATSVCAAEIAGDPEAVAHISGYGKVPAVQVRTAIKVRVLITAEQFDSG